MRIAVASKVGLIDVTDPTAAKVAHSQGANGGTAHRTEAAADLLSSSTVGGCQHPKSQAVCVHLADLRDNRNSKYLADRQNGIEVSVSCIFTATTTTAKSSAVTSGETDFRHRLPAHRSAHLLKETNIQTAKTPGTVTTTPNSLCFNCSA
jgi:hypothetical protein